MEGDLIDGDERLLAPVRDLILEIEAPAVLVSPLEANAGQGSVGEIIERCLGESRLTLAEAEVLYAVVALAETSDVGIAERGPLLERLGIKRPTLYKRLGPLINAGVVREYKIPTQRRGPNPRIFILDPVRLADASFTAAETRATMNIAESAEAEGGEHAAMDLFGNRGMPAPRDLPIKGDQLAIFALPALLPSRPKSDPEYIEQAVRYGNQYLQTTVRSSSGIRMARVRDTRILAAVITICFDRIHRQGLAPTNPWVMRIEEIIEVLNTRAEGEAAFGHGGSHKQWILEVLRRWQGTQFEIKHITPRMRAYYGGLVSLEESFRFINRLHVLSWVGSKGSTPEDVCIYLDDLLVERMKSEQFAYSLTLQTSMMDEPNDLAYRLALWCRRAIKRNHSPQHYSLDALHMEADPTAQAKAFRHSVRKLYAERSAPKSQVMHLHGYCFRLIDGGQGFAVWADPDDTLLGAQSYAARKLGRRDETD